MGYYQKELERQNEIWNYQLKNLFNHCREKTELSICSVEKYYKTVLMDTFYN